MFLFFCLALIAFQRTLDYKRRLGKVAVIYYGLEDFSQSPIFFYCTTLFISTNLIFINFVTFGFGNPNGSASVAIDIYASSYHI